MKQSKETFEEILVPVVWFKKLLEISEQAKKEADEYMKKSARVPIYIYELIGYVGSAEILIKYKKHEKTK